MPSKQWYPRLNVELPEEQVRWLQALPYGVKKHLFSSLVGELIEACNQTGPDGKPLKYAIISNLIGKRISLLDVSPTIRRTIDEPK